MGMLSWEGTTVSSFCESTLAVTVHIGSFLTKVVGFLHFCFAKIHSEAFNFTKKRFHWRCFHVSFTKHWFRCTRIKTERAVQSYCVIVIRYSFGKFYCLKYVREDTAYLLKLNSTFLVIYGWNEKELQVYQEYLNLKLFSIIKKKIGKVNNIRSICIYFHCLVLYISTRKQKVWRRLVNASIVGLFLDCKFHTKTLQSEWSSNLTKPTQNSAGYCFCGLWHFQIKTLLNTIPP